MQEKLGRLGIMNPVITPAWVDVFYDDWLCSSALAEREIGYETTPIADAVLATMRWLRTGREDPEERS